MMHYRQMALACLLAMAPAARAADLLQAWQAAQAFDSSYLSARYERDAGQEKNVQGRAGLLPRVGLEGGYTRTNPIAPAGSLPGGASLQDAYETRSWGVKLSQPLFDVGSYTGWRKGQVATALSDTRFDSTRQSLMVDVARAYFDVLLAEDTLAATRSAKKAYETQLAQARAAFELGTATITDTYEAQAGYDGAAAEEISALNTLEISRITFARLTGLDATRLQPLADRIDLRQPGDLSDWQARARENSPAIRAAGQELDLAEHTLTEKRGGTLPVIALNAGYQNNHSNAAAAINPSADTRGSSIGVSISLPLFAGGGIRSQITEAAALRDSQREKLEDARRKTDENVRRAWLGVSNGAAYVRAQEQQRISAASKRDATRLGRDVGVRTNLDLLQAEQAYTDVVKKLAQARYQYLTARLQLAQAAGTLDETLLEDINAALRH